MQHMIYYHGTGSEFKPGDVLTPEGVPEKARNYNFCKGWVYFTARRETAMTFAYGAAYFPGGQTRRVGGKARLYQVAAPKEWKDDPHLPKGAARRTKRLRVIRELKVRPREDL
jgi:hypothetical protein